MTPTKFELKPGMATREAFGKAPNADERERALAEIGA